MPRVSKADKKAIKLASTRRSSGDTRQDKEEGYPASDDAIRAVKIRMEEEGPEMYDVLMGFLSEVLKKTLKKLQKLKLQIWIVRENFHQKILSKLKIF